MRFHAARTPVSRVLPDLATAPVDLSVLITPAPRLSEDELKRRQSPDLRRCGYINGNSASELRCSGDYSCAFGDPGLGKVFGCCNEVSCSQGVAVTCVDAYENICKSYGDLGCSYLGSVLSCRTACVTYIVPETSMYGYGSYTSWACGSTPTKIVVLKTTTADLPPDVTGIDQSQTDLNTDLPGFGPSTTRGRVASQTGGNSGGSTSDPTSHNIGMIVGIVAGVLVLLAVGITALVFCIRRKRRQKAEKKRIEEHQQQFVQRNGAGQSERMMVSEHGASVAHWVMNGYDDRQTVIHSGR